jgi:hypothetical protein
MLKRIINWIRPSLEGDDNKSSYRRLSALVLLMLMVYLGVAGKITNTTMFYALLVYSSTFLMLVGILTADNIITFVSKCRGNSTCDKDKEESK